MGFEPTKPFQTYLLSRKAYSTALPTHRNLGCNMGLEPTSSSVTTKRFTIKLTTPYNIWQREWDLNPRPLFSSAQFPIEYLKPLSQHAINLVEEVGFEPTGLLHPIVFKTIAINQTLPLFLLLEF